MIKVLREQNNVVEIEVSNLKELEEKAKNIVNEISSVTDNDLKFSVASTATLIDDIMLRSVVTEIVNSGLIKKNEYKIFKVGNSTTFYISTMDAPNESLSGINYGIILL